MPNNTVITGHNHFRFLQQAVLALMPVLGACLTTNSWAETLRFDFETGDLQGWEIVAGSFSRPVRTHPQTANDSGGGFFLTTEGASEQLDGGPNHGSRTTRPRTPPGRYRMAVSCSRAGSTWTAASARSRPCGR